MITGRRRAVALLTALLTVTAAGTAAPAPDARAPASGRTDAAAAPGGAARDQALTSLTGHAERVAAQAAKNGPAARPDGPNPLLQATGSGSAGGGELDDWIRWGRQQAAPAPAGDAGYRSFAAVGDEEPAGGRGGNDTPGRAQPLPLSQGQGTASGTIAPMPGHDRTAGPFPEDDGSIPRSTPVAVGQGETVQVDGTIGDGPHGDSTGDFDVVEVRLEAGQSLTFQVDTPIPTPNTLDLDPSVEIYDGAGSFQLVVDDRRIGRDIDGDGESRDDDNYDVYGVFTPRRAGSYYLFVTASGSFPSDPHDARSGNGAGSSGSYDLTLSTVPPDIDYYAVSVAEGEVLSADVHSNQAMGLELADPEARLAMVSVVPGVVLAQSPDAPAPLDGVAGIPRVAERAGTWYIGVFGVPGGYQLEFRVDPPGLARAGGARVQKIFVDFDGATVNPAADFATGPEESRRLAPLADFLPRWGLQASDEDAVIDAVMGTVERLVDRDLRGTVNGDRRSSGRGGEFDVELYNSRDHQRPPDAAHVIVGGTRDQFEIDTIGLASLLDVGNYTVDDLAVVLLGDLSAPASNGDSLNQFGVGGGATKIGLVGEGVGAIAAHEIGHLLGNFHTDNGNDTLSLMDTGGKIADIAGVGPDRTWGTADDILTRYSTDVLDAIGPFGTFGPNSTPGFIDTAATSAYGLSTGSRDGLARVVVLGGEAAVSGRVVDTLAAETGAVVRRTAGSGRYDTAARIVDDTFDSAETVYLATGENFPDALSGAAAAARVGAPVLLTHPTILPDATVQQLRELGPATVVVLGGTAAVGEGVVDQVRAATGATVRRIAGRNRYDTAARTVAEVFDRADTVYLATGEAFPDALSGAAAAARIDAPVLLTRPTSLPPETERRLRDLQPRRVVILGGGIAVRAPVVAALDAFVEDVDRYSGPTRYHTAANIVAAVFDQPPPVVYVATGRDFPDALAGAAAAAAAGAPVLLTEPGALPEPPTALLRGYATVG